METIISAPKTDTFRFRINPEIRKQVEEVYAQNGLTLTQAINVFIQQSINVGGLPFAIPAESAEVRKAKALNRLMSELEKGEQSGDPIPAEDVYKMLGVEL
ncbi:MAG: type II toxin-antitoxin system RelB/DinJ family antitoxin [Oscillospiraceae bacterium]|nr:type II toxin-antitoxin system RelB/DinJ family antitoxin [Oscillospiraceae bacterium]